MVIPLVLGTNNNDQQTFGAFYEVWLVRQEHYLQELLRLIAHDGTKDCDQENELRSKELVVRVMAHYNEYFAAKARAVHDNVFLVLTPPWMSSFERAYQWIGGFRAGLVFRLVFNNVVDLTEEQSQKMKTLLEEMKEEEKELTDELTRLQEAMTSPSMVALTRNMGRPMNGAAAELDAAFDRLRVSMETLVQCADSLRKKAAVSLMETLKPTQAVRFLAAAAQLNLNLRRFGLQRDGRIQRDA